MTADTYDYKHNIFSLLLTPLNFGFEYRFRLCFQRFLNLSSPSFRHFIQYQLYLIQFFDFVIISGRIFYKCIMSTAFRQQIQDYELKTQKKEPWMMRFSFLCKDVSCGKIEKPRRPKGPQRKITIDYVASSFLLGRGKAANRMSLQSLDSRRRSITIISRQNGLF